MKLQHLEYIIAVDNYRHFARAAEACFVTQPTLSMMIQKLEIELGVKIFDRSKQPVIPTEMGELIIAQARVVLREKNKIGQIVNEQQRIVSGSLELGIIPTLAPYLVPLFITQFLRKYPLVRIRIQEVTTELLIDKLKKGQIDVGILVTPFNDAAIRETPLFYEAFMVYSSHTFEKAYLLPEDINPNELWLLEEGHCFRSQILNLCELKKQTNSHLQYEAGSIETLKQLVEKHQGVTILPELAIRTLSPGEKKRLTPFKSPVPTREVSLVTHRDFIKKNKIDALKEEILTSLPPEVCKKEDYFRVSLQE